MSTATAVRTPLTRPRLSGRILVGTTALVTTVLVLWLLLWFVRQSSNPASVQAFHVPDHDVPFLEADVQGLAGPSGEVQAVSFADLGSKLVDQVSQGSRQAVVLAISGPIVGGSGASSPVALIRAIAGAAQRNVLIVLDVAQIDSDRELGIYGDAPYQGLEEELKKINPTSHNVNIAVLCSCEPGQKSWAADGLGRSAFSYFVQKGLAGTAWSASPAGGHRGAAAASERNPRALEEYVRRQVSSWVATERQAALQTPVLLPVGKSSVDFKLPRLTLLDPAGPAQPESNVKEAMETARTKETADKKEVAEKKEPSTPDPRETLFQDLMTAWKDHDDLKNGAEVPAQKPPADMADTRATGSAGSPGAGSSIPPYRLLPAEWHAYETFLLRAERLVRASRTDRNEADAAAKALRRATAYHGQLRNLLKGRRDQMDAAMVYRPVRTEPRNSDEEAELNKALKFVTHGFSDDLAKPPPPKRPSKPATGAGGKADESALASAAADSAGDQPPRELNDADGQPETHLELQLPLWAKRFHETFPGSRWFFGTERGKQLRLAVEKRLDAETALAVDRRGLDWIKPLIEKGDDTRRDAQDRLFDASEVEALKGLETRFKAYGETYAEAHQRISLHRDARSLLEEIAAELPFLGEWLVLDEEAQGPAPGGLASAKGPALPAPLDSVFRTAVALADALEAGYAPETAKREEAIRNLPATFTSAREAFDSFTEKFKERAVALRNSQESRNWRMIDAVLRCPSIEHNVRSSLLKIVTERSALPDGASPAGRPDGGADPLFYRQGRGLARLELILHKLAFSGHGDDGHLKSLEKVLQSLPGFADRAGNSSTLAKTTDETLEGFRDVTGQVATLRAQDVAGSLVGQSEQSEQKVGELLRDADRDVRFRPAGPRDPAQCDRVVADLDAFSSRQMLLFQAHRLSEDYALVDDVAKLRTRAENLHKMAAPIPSGYHKGHIKPVFKSPLAIDPKEQKAVLEVGVSIDSPAGESATVPRGQAFVGALPTIATDKKILVVSTAASAATDPAGALVEVGNGPVSPASVRFEVKQQITAAQGTGKQLLAAVFYRGRVEPESQDSRLVTVKLAKFGQPIVVSISQDREALARRFPRDVAEKIEDQFSKHPGYGYIHEKGKLDCVLTFHNQSKEPQVIEIESTLEAEGEPKPTASAPPSRQQIEPGKNYSIKRTITHLDLPEGPKTLTVKVTYPNNKDEPPQIEKFVFTRLRLDDYIEFSTTQKEKFLINIRRKEEDKVTEPIPFSEMRYSVNNEAPHPTDDYKESDYLYLGRYVDVRVPILAGDVGKVMKWEVEIEKAKKSGEYKIQ